MPRTTDFPFLVDNSVDTYPNSGVKIGVVTFPGTLDDRDACRAVRLAGGEPVNLWHADGDIKDVQALSLIHI